MSDEQFDKHIKQQLESVRPVFEESAWQKFRTAMPLPWYTTLFRDWGGWIFGGIASMAFLTMLYFNYLQQKANKLLHEEISTLKNTSTPAITNVDTVFLEKYKTDTVFIVKTIRQVVEVPVRENAVNNRFMVSTPARSETFETPATQEGRETANRTIVGIGSVKNNQNQAEKSGKTSNTDEKLVSQNQPNLKENVGETEKTIKKLTDENGNVSRENPELTKEKFESTDKPILVDLAIPEPKKQETGTKKKFQFPYVRTRVGIGSDILGLKVPSVGPVGEFFFGYSNLSFGTGLLFSSPQEKRFDVSKDFNNSTGKQFEDFYKDKFRPQQQPRKIEDITIRTSFIKVPVAFNYYVNTRNNLSFMFTAGTRLDVSIFQDIQFKSNMLTDKTNEKFEARPKPKVFNGLFYGMGLQYQKNRFVGQFTPYFDFKFRQNDFLITPRTFGIKASVKYDFGRGL